jgi:8-oxo-dGTP pyrophosphatase MutT (NUDIX family)
LPGRDAPWPVPAPALSVAEVERRLGEGVHTGSEEPTFDQARPSAVLVLLADGADGAEVLLTRRTANLSSHRGEVSFPGGRLDAGETYEAAAVREAFEEVGVPQSEVTLLGRLHPIATLVSRSWIVPVVARLERPVALTPNPHEVDRAFWHPLADLTRPGTFREERWQRAEHEFVVTFFELDDETVWGATARVLHQLLRIAHGIEGGALSTP